MRLIITLALAAPLTFLGSCSKAESASLAGSYQIDTAELDALMREELVNATPAQRKATEVMLESLAASTFEISADGTFKSTSSLMGMDSAKSGTWTTEGAEITFTTTERNGKPATEVRVGTIKDGVITVADTQGGKTMNIVMRKK